MKLKNTSLTIAHATNYVHDTLLGLNNPQDGENATCQEQLELKTGLSDMHLLNTRTPKLETFLGRGKPKYAILSHTWGNDEVLYEDVRNSPVSVWSKKAGGSKVQRSAGTALKNDLYYIWVDTCCIDKSSSAELSEAINSMYLWYRRSSVCYAYLSDVLIRDEAILFPNSRWFARGLTLQELIAPLKVDFYDREWRPIGSRADLASRITAITSIDFDLLAGKESSRPADLNTYSVSQRMAWASRRHTTRVEDEAYCLMGIFDVNMPLLYGEGQKAFRRLQEEVLKRTNDQSIMVYNMSMSNQSHNHVLAPSPNSFDGMPLVRRHGGPDLDAIRLTSDGLQVRLQVCPVLAPTPVDATTKVGLLDCFVNVDDTWISRAAIVVTKLKNSYYLQDRLGIYIVRPDRGDIAGRLSTSVISDGYDELKLDIGRMATETIILHMRPRDDRSVKPSTEAQTLRLNPISQSTTTKYQLGPSIPARSCDIMGLENTLHSAWSPRTVAIIVVTAETEKELTYPFLLIIHHAAEIMIHIFENNYHFTQPDLVSPESLQEALRYSSQNIRSPQKGLVHKIPSKSPHLL
ncbi:putative Heterokaryon incompatibility protein-domain-containing protein [Seiridium cardinale]|uniref:Heterokaryon incompatibility protein-domain-containing protein n=1 Tax=Seiridium cardinale TaxID=138064 RepID=A0ABR2Y3C3_9PEZI